MQDVYKNIVEYNPIIKCNVFLVFDNTIAGMICNRKLNYNGICQEYKSKYFTFFITRC